MTDTYKPKEEGRRRRKIPEQVKWSILESYEGKCANTYGAVLGWPCMLHGTTLVPQTAQFDHVQELADGGEDIWENLQPLCALCHDQKSRARQRERAPRSWRMDVDPLPPTRCTRKWRDEWAIYCSQSPSPEPQTQYQHFCAWAQTRSFVPPSEKVFRRYVQKCECESPCDAMSVD